MVCTWRGGGEVDHRDTEGPEPTATTQKELLGGDGGGSGPSVSLW